MMRLISCVLLLALAACSEGRRDLTAVEVANIVRAGDAINARHTAALEAIYPPLEAWPQPIVALNPETVRVEPGMGVYFRIHDGWFRESGYFVPLRSVWKKRAGDPSYEEIAPGLYWYRIKS
jgi:hypothetical protein